MKNIIILSLLTISLFITCNKPYRIQTENNIDQNTKCIHIHNHSDEKKSSSEIVRVTAIGCVDESDIDDAIEIIESFYGYKCVVVYGESITDDIRYKGSNDVLDGDAIINKYFSKNKVVYLIDKKLWAKGAYLRGIAAVNGGTVVVRGEKSFLKETVIHELGHTLGLRHCSDLTCIMAENNDEFDSGTFCDKCSRQIGFKK
jgi:hypothetical protein